MIKRKNKHEYRVCLGDTSLVPYTPDQIDEVLNWCNMTFGPSGRNKKYRWRYGWVIRERDIFYFRDEKDALFFVLKWS